MMSFSFAMGSLVVMIGGLPDTLEMPLVLLVAGMLGGRA
jgi:hypothetical protein